MSMKCVLWTMSSLTHKYEPIDCWIWNNDVVTHHLTLPKQCWCRGTAQARRIQAMPSASWWRSEFSAARHAEYVTHNGWTTASSCQHLSRPPLIEVKGPTSCIYNTLFSQVAPTAGRACPGVKGHRRVGGVTLCSLLLKHFFYCIEYLIFMDYINTANMRVTLSC